MGIEGLLPFLKPITYSSHISAFENQTVAVDAMSWLYRGCYSCSFELNMNIPTKDYLYYINKSILMLKRHHIKPILVFDGRHLLVKKKTEEHRKKQKYENLEKAKSFLEKGDQKEARKYFSRAIKITKEMIYQTVDLLKQMKVDFIIAPYEADAQVAFLIRNSYAHLAISEDSDLICYGCPKIIFKLGLSGECQFLNLLDYKEPQRRIALKDKQLKSFLAFDREKLIHCCIMAGCDYLPSIKGIGIKKAVDFLSRFGKIDGTVRRLQFEKTFMGRIPKDYAKTVKKIALVFKYQRVFDPDIKGFTTLEELPEEMNNESNNILIGEEFKEIEAFINGDVDMKKLEKRDYEMKTINEMLKMPENTRSYPSKKYDKIEISRKNEEFSNKKLNRSVEIEDWNVIEGDIFVKANQSEERSSKNNGDFNRISNKKMEEQIDYLFNICQQFSDEFAKENDKNESHFEENKQKQKEMQFQMEKEENQIITSKDIKEKYSKKTNLFNDSDEKTKISSSLKKKTIKFHEKTDIFPEIPPLKKFKETIIKEKTLENPFAIIKETAKKQEVQSPENPFAIEKASNKKEAFFVDSLTKLSTEKLSSSAQETNGKIAITPMKNLTITPMKNGETKEKKEVFFEKKTEKKVLIKRKDENRGFFEENRNPANLMKNLENLVENQKKKVKIVDSCQAKIQRFFRR